MRHPLTMLTLALAVVAGATACNPLVTDPVSVGGELDEVAVEYSGPDGAWLDATVTGSAGTVVYGFVLIANDQLHGPAARSCGGAPPQPCVVTLSDVRMPGQRIVPAAGSPPVPLMTVWSGETVQLVLVCVDPATQELGCPASLRLVVGAADAVGNRVGAVGPA